MASTPGDLQQLDLLIHALERAHASCAGAQGDESLAAGLEVLGTCYAALTPSSSPEASQHLEAAYDACLRGLGSAYGGDGGDLVAAVAVVRAIRDALQPRRPALYRAA